MATSKLTAICPVHELFEIANMIYAPSSASVTFNGTATTCFIPSCRELCLIRPGTYEFTGEIIQAFIEGGASVEHIEKFRSLLLKFQSGEISPAEMEVEASKLNASFGKIITYIRADSAFLSLVVSLLALLIPLLAGNSSDQSAQQAHDDAREQIRLGQEQQVIDRKMLEGNERSRLIQDKIYEELLKRPFRGASKAKQKRTKQKLLTPLLPQKRNSDGFANRHERRKASRIARRNP